MAAFKAGELQFFTDLIEFNDAAVFAAAAASLRTTEWVVYAKRPFMNANAVLAYLARYAHRVAITNSRLLGLDETHVSFRWKDYRQGGHQKNRVTRMEIAEFIRRFLLHVLPNGFHRIRHYGILANGHRAEKLARCRSLLLAPAATPDCNSDDASESGISNHEACPCCGGRMRIMETFDGSFSRPRSRSSKGDLRNGQRRPCTGACRSIRPNFVIGTGYSRYAKSP
jgi:Putative transposase